MGAKARPVLGALLDTHNCGLTGSRPPATPLAGALPGWEAGLALALRPQKRGFRSSVHATWWQAQKAAFNVTATRKPHLFAIICRCGFMPTLSMNCTLDGWARTNGGCSSVFFLAAGKTLCKEPNAFLMAGPCEKFAAV